MKKIVIFFLLVICSSGVIYAHKGRTDGYGGHYNRSEGTYHYHSGQYAGTGEYTKPVEEGGVKISQEENTETSSGLIVNTDTNSTELEELKTRISTLEHQMQEKQDTIDELNNEIEEKNEKIDRLEDKSSEYIAFGFILIMTIIISYNIGKNKE